MCISVLWREELCHSFPADLTGNLDNLFYIATSQQTELWKTKLNQELHTPFLCLISNCALATHELITDLQQEFNNRSLIYFTNCNSGGSIHSSSKVLFHSCKYPLIGDGK